MGPVTIADEEKFRVALFDGNNFNNWKFRLQTVLDEHGLLIYINRSFDEIFNGLDSTKADDASKILEHTKNDKKCKSLIVRRIADSHLEYIKEKTTSREIINALESTFERKSIASQLYLRRRILTLKCAENEDLEKHFMLFDGLVRELKTTGATLEPLDVVCHLLMTLPDSYNVVVTALETMDSTKLDIEFVKSRLLDEASKRKQVTDNGTKFADGVAMNSGGGTFKCFKCGEIGHKRSACPKNGKKSQNSFKKKTKNSADGQAHATADNGAISFIALDQNAFATMCSSEVTSINWCIDSGATEHMVNNEKYFAELKSLKTPMKIGVAKNGITLAATKIGTIHGNVIVDGKWQQCTVENVLYIENLQCNLFSVRRLEEAGLKTVFADGKVSVYKGNRKLITANRVNRLYQLEMKLQTNFAGVVTNDCDELDLWHRRLGHLNGADVKRLSVGKMADGMSDLSKSGSNFCEPCIFGKQTRKPFSKINIARSKRILEIVHSDVCGPVNPTAWNGHHYFVTFVDDYTHFVTVYTIEKKSDVLKSFMDYSEKVQARFGQRISRLRCDNGGEYKSNEFKRFCSTSGIDIEFTIPYTPEQNGVAERMNRTLVEKARTMIHESGLEKHLWNEAVLCAAYTTNRSPTRALVGKRVNKTPAELWYDKKPNLSNLRVFGSAAYTHIPKIKRSKIDSKSIKNVMVGYSCNGYRLYNFENGEVVTARDVIFHEDESKAERSSDEANCETFEVCEPDGTHETNEAPNESDENSGENEHPNDEGAQNNSIITEDEDDGNDCENVSNEAGMQQVADLRRGTRVRKQTKFYGVSALALNAENLVDDVPNSFGNIKGRDDEGHWMAAVKSEMDSLLRNETWQMTELPKGRSVVDCKWVFKRKRGENGAAGEYKARLVARGFSQRKGFDFEETYSPVAKMTTFRTLLAIAVRNNLHIHQMDVKTAFLNGNLREEIYMRQPEGFENGNLVCKLNKSLYGLKQASRMWNERFHQCVTNLGFKRSEYDYCLYSKGHDELKIYLLLYVDDLVLVGSCVREIERIKLLMSKEFEMKDMNELKNFLGICIERDMSKGTLHFHQKPYLMNVLKRFGMENCNGIGTPMERQLKLPKSNENVTTTMPYRELIGCLMYAMITSRPDISAAVNYFSQFQSCATDEHWKHLKRILRYLKRTLDLKLVYERDNDGDTLVGYAGADWANDVNDRKSVSGHVFQVYGSTVSWMTRKQSTVSLSSTEAEFIALSTAACEAIWIGGVLRELNVELIEPITMYEDNQACIHIAEEPREHRRMKHIDVKFNHIRELIVQQQIKVKYMPTKEQLADIMTKGVVAILFNYLRAKLGMK